MANSNSGDGFNNDGTNTNFTNNRAMDNSQDCTDDATEGSSLGTVSGNFCADGHVFDWESTLADYD